MLETWQESVTRILGDVRHLLVLAGIKEDKIDLLSQDGLDHEAMYASITALLDKEVAAYEEVLALRKPEMWTFYAAKGIKNLEECKLRVKAEADLRRAFRGVFKRGPKTAKDPQ